MPVRKQHISKGASLIRIIWYSTVFVGIIVDVNDFVSDNKIVFLTNEQQS